MMVQDQHVEKLVLNDAPDSVYIQVYVTNAYRAHKIANSYWQGRISVALGGLHVTSLLDEALFHADITLLDPGEEVLPRFIEDSREEYPQKRYVASWKSLENVLPVCRDLIRGEKYLISNSLVVSGGCPHHCDFYYKDAFYSKGKSSYIQRTGDALVEIDKLPSRHLYFLDDHLLGNPRFASELLDRVRGMGRVFQSATTVASVLNGNLIEKVAKAGLRGLLLGFETFSPESPRSSSKLRNLSKDYIAAVEQSHRPGTMVNGSLILDLDHDDKDVLHRTVDWGTKRNVTTAAFYILTPYPGIQLPQRMEWGGRVTSHDQSKYGTKTVVYRTMGLSIKELKQGYDWTYREFHSWKNIFDASFSHDNLKQQFTHLLYMGGWKKFEPFWNSMIQHGNLNCTLPVLEGLLTNTGGYRNKKNSKFRYGDPKNRLPYEKISNH